MIIKIVLSTYKIDGAFSCYRSKMIRWKEEDVVYCLRLLGVVVTFHASHSDVFERLSARLKRISYYALRLVLNRVFNINLLVPHFSYSFGYARFDFFGGILMIVFHLCC